MVLQAELALVERKPPVFGQVAVFEAGDELDPAVPVVMVVAAAAVLVAAWDAAVSDMPADRDSAPVVASVPVAYRMSAALVAVMVYPDPAPTLSADRARSERSRWRGPNSGCRNMDNA